MRLIREGAFLSEIIYQADLVLHAADRINNYISDLQDDTKNSPDDIIIWSSIQSILSSSSNISKILWPKDKFTERGEYLRSLLNINNDCNLRNKYFRNKFEHYDEVLDKYFNKNNISHYTDLAMNPNMSGIGTSCHRGYNTTDHTLVLHGKILDLKEIVETVRQIKLKCKSLFL